mmetsp:Transcript_5766/g.12805  ORF Transcript_5766/g.12805 Transcript_5766/m.12805 type:complete len:91 (+) Transcript_5766:643-915(+)
MYAPLPLTYRSDGILCSIFSFTPELQLKSLSNMKENSPPTMEMTTTNNSTKLNSCTIQLWTTKAEEAKRPTPDNKASILTGVDPLVVSMY